MHLVLRQLTKDTPKSQARTSINKAERVSLLKAQFEVCSDYGLSEEYFKWEQLPKYLKVKHSLRKCEACYDNYYSFQQLFPEKPIYCRETVVSIDMEQATTENALTRNVLQDLITNTTTNSIDHLLTQLW